MDKNNISVIKTRWGYEATYSEGDKSMSVLRRDKTEAIQALISDWESDAKEW